MKPVKFEIGSLVRIHVRSHVRSQVRPVWGSRVWFRILNPIERQILEIRNQILNQACRCMDPNREAGREPGLEPGL
jgi:hypothetical protein